MKHKFFIKKALAMLLVLAYLLSVAACGSNDNDTGSAEQSDDGKDYVIKVVSDTGAVLENVTVFIYSDSALADLVAVEHTDGEGVASFDLPAKESYTAVLSDVPAGYAKEEKYTVTDKNTTLVLTTVLSEDADKVYKNGDVMYNFNLTDINGNTYKLSELIKTKRAVVLNFWFIGCNPCALEFPYLNEAYELYKDKVELIAINPTDENVKDIQDYVNEKGLTMPVVAEKLDWQTRMDVSAYPTTVVIDRHGRICLVHQGSITDTEEFTKIFAYFSAEDYEQTVLNGIGEIDSPEDSSDTDGNPKEVGGVTEFEMTVEPGQTEYCDVYKISHMNLTVDNADAAIIYNGEEYSAENGIVSLFVIAEDTFTPIKLGVKNKGDKKQTFKIMFSYPLGSSGNPHTLTLGEFDTRLDEGNDQGVFYKYVAEADGALTLECLSSTEGVEYDYVLYNLDSYAQRSLSADGEEGKNSISIDAKKGQTVTVTIGTAPDSAGSYPAADFTSLASFEEGEIQDTNSGAEYTEYSVTVKDAEGKAVEGVKVKFTADGDTLSVSTDANGVASASLSADSCTVSLAGVEGYTVKDEKITLTQETSSHIFTIYKLATEELTITVKDKDGKAVKDVLITIGDSFKKTDGKGQLKFDLPVSSTETIEYTAVISLPEGYKADKTSYTFKAGLKKLDITVEKNNGSGSSAQNPSYSVTVKKADGTPVPNVAVVFEKNGTSAAVKTTDAKGVATASLEKGNYTAKLAFADGVNLNYDKSSAKLTASLNSITVTVAEPVSNETAELYVGDAHSLSLGGNYSKLNMAEGEELAYFLFTPEKSGTYSFTTSYSGTKISYHGANTSYIFDQTSSTDYKNNLFTLNVKEGNIGASYIIGVKGESDCVIIVKRTGNATLGIEDLPWTVYKPKKAPIAFSLGASKFTASYFDITAKTDDYKLVYNSADGYYHLGDKNGKVVYVMLGEAAPYVSFAKLIETTGLKKYFYDANGNFVKKEDYTECMIDYVNKMDKATGLYPLTDDLMYIIKANGDFASWWDKSSPAYLFTDLDGVNTDIAWMFALCTVTTN